MLGDAAEIGAGYLRLLDRYLPGRVDGFYLTGSSALGEFCPGRSDLDFVAVLDWSPSQAELRRLRLVHLLSGLQTTARALGRRWLVVSGTCNGVFVRSDDLTLPVTAIKPIASHTAERFFLGTAFDVNPVMWKVLADRGVSLRGGSPAGLGLDPEPDKLRQWNVDNLNGYWREWGERLSSTRRPKLSPGRSFRYGQGWTNAWGALGAPRLHHTITTGEVIGKLSAGQYAMEAFDPAWRPLIARALQFWHRERLGSPPEGLVRQTGEFVLEVVASANKVGGVRDELGPKRPDF